MVFPFRANRRVFSFSFNLSFFSSTRTASDLDLRALWAQLITVKVSLRGLRLARPSGTALRLVEPNFNFSSERYLPIPRRYPFLGIGSVRDRLQVGPRYFGPVREDRPVARFPRLASRFFPPHSFAPFHYACFSLRADPFKGPRYHPFPGGVDLIK